MTTRSRKGKPRKPRPILGCSGGVIAAVVNGWPEIYCYQDGTCSFYPKDILKLELWCNKFNRWHAYLESKKGE